MIWLLIALIAVIILLNRRPVSNCPGCAWAVDGQCGHPTASQVPEAAEIQMGAWRCPWRELAPRSKVTVLDALDTCECGRLPEIVVQELEGQDREEYSAVCVCGRHTWWHGTIGETVAAWNQRSCYGDLLIGRRGVAASFRTLRREEIATYELVQT